MSVSRRSFLKTTAAVFALPTVSTLTPWREALANNAWNTYEIITEISLTQPAQQAQVWVPLPLVQDTPYFKTVSLAIESGAKASLLKSSTGQSQFVHASWDNNQEKKLRIIKTVSTTERQFVKAKANPALKLSAEEKSFWTRGTELLPTDGIVAQKTAEILKPLPKNSSEIDKAKAIYNWVVENTFRNPKTRGCGIGDVKGMLETNNLSGKCADLNAVFVALARSAGLPARDVYGIRVADSARGYKSLGKSGDITKAQHCRAEFYAQGYGWIAVDPADVRKVILEEAGGLPITDPKVVAIRNYLFGNWEMNWMAYNYDHDLMLPGSSLGSQGKVPFLMYPQAEVNGQRLDSLDPDNFKYKITSRQIV